MSALVTMRRSPVAAADAAARRVRARPQGYARRPAIAAPGSTRSSIAPASRKPRRSRRRPIRCRRTAGRPRGQSYQNVKVLGELSTERFNHLMAEMNQWVAPPEQGCNYCHNPENMASDEKYTKVVARRMLQMTQDDQFALVEPRQADRRHLLHLPPRQCRARDTNGRWPTARPIRDRSAATSTGRTRPTPMSAMPRCRPIRSPRIWTGRRKSASPASSALPVARPRRVDQGCREELWADDAHQLGAGGQLHLLPQHPVVPRLEPEPGAARHRLLRHPHGARHQRRITSRRCRRCSRPIARGRTATRTRSIARPATRALSKPLGGVSMIDQAPSLRGASGRRRARGRRRRRRPRCRRRSTQAGAR